jgi:hypothetical protein
LLLLSLLCFLLLVSPSIKLGFQFLISYDSIVTLLSFLCFSQVCSSFGKPLIIFLKTWL